jgi:hyperosmotically inducible periplasmic protein
MKTLSKQTLSLLLLAGTLGLFSAGCASTPTKESTGEYVDDSTITTKVKAALLGDDAVKSFEIKVTTFKGVVQLSGFVDTADQSLAAARDAKNVGGVSDVQNNITVK